MRERDIVRFRLAEKQRVGVVIEVQGDRVRVAYGTTQDHVSPHESVGETSRQGRSFPLRELTRFYGANTSWEPLSDLERGSKPCSWELLYAIRKLVEAYDASLPELHIRDKNDVVHMAKLVSPIGDVSRPVTRCGCELSRPWQLASEDEAPTCAPCVAR